MTHIIEIPLESGGTILIETARADVTSRRGFTADEITTKVTQTFEVALGKIRPAADAVIDQLRHLSVVPDEIGIEFGIKLNADAKAYIASAGAEANFKVTVRWKRKESEPNKP